MNATLPCPWRESIMVPRTGTSGMCAAGRCGTSRYFLRVGWVRSAWRSVPSSNSRTLYADDLRRGSGCHIAAMAATPLIRTKPAIAKPSNVSTSPDRDSTETHSMSRPPRSVPPSRPDPRLVPTPRPAKMTSRPLRTVCHLQWPRASTRAGIVRQDRGGRAD
jgi:hypothetical protein